MRQQNLVMLSDREDVFELLAMQELLARQDCDQHDMDPRLSTDVF